LAKRTGVASRGLSYRPPQLKEKVIRKRRMFWNKKPATSGGWGGRWVEEGTEKKKANAHRGEAGQGDFLPTVVRKARRDSRKNRREKSVERSQLGAEELGKGEFEKKKRDLKKIPIGQKNKGSQKRSKKHSGGKGGKLKRKNIKEKKLRGSIKLWGIPSDQASKTDSCKGGALKEGR